MIKITTSDYLRPIKKNREQTRITHQIIKLKELQRHHRARWLMLDIKISALNRMILDLEDMKKNICWKYTDKTKQQKREKRLKNDGKEI